jgi:hypothetical protein
MRRRQKLLGIIDVNFDVMNKILIRYNVFIRHLRKRLECSGTVHQLYASFGQALRYSVRKEVLYNIFMECATPMKLVRLIEICLKEI